MKQDTIQWLETAVIALMAALAFVTLLSLFGSVILSDDIAKTAFLYLGKMSFLIFSLLFIPAAVVLNILANHKLTHPNRQ